MPEVKERESLRHILRLATDLCLSLGAFAVTPTGAVHQVVSDAVRPGDLASRIDVLARSCLTHPAASGPELFWNAEIFRDVGSPDASLACAVTPIWAPGAARGAGLLGIVDTWLPEPDAEQRAGLRALAEELAGLLPATTPGRPPTKEHGHESPAEHGAPAGAEHRAENAAENGAKNAAENAAENAGPSISASELAAALGHAIVVLDASGTVVLANRAADALYGLPAGRTLVGSPLPRATWRADDGELLDADDHPAALVLADGVARTMTVTIGERDGQRRLGLSARPFAVRGRLGALLEVHDTTEEWAEQQRLSRYAMYDPLTGLANRYLLLEELRRMLQGLARHGGSVALVYLDLDKFKRINDEYGHDMGDEVLGAVARRLRGAVRSDDVVARLGGDEFVIAHASPESSPEGELVVSRLRKVLSAPFRVRGHAFDVGASIGWVSTDRSDVGPDTILAKADRAMYQHKRDRRDPSQVDVDRTET